MNDDAIGPEWVDTTRRRIWQTGAALIGTSALSRALSANHQTQFREITSALVTPEGPVAMADGSVLVCEMLAGRLTRVLPDGNCLPLAALGGAPNGAAIGPDGACYVVNNGGFNSAQVNGKLQMRPGLPANYHGGSVQRVDLHSGAVSTLYPASESVPLRGPNDLVFDNSGGFYFTDLGKIADGKIDYGAVYWAKADGTAIRAVVPMLLTPNGIGLSPDRRTLYVALTEKRQVVAYDIVAPGELRQEAGRPVRRVVVSVGGDLSFDSMKVEANGNLVVATLQLGCLSVFSPRGAMVKQVFFPDAAVTNLAFGGHDLRTVYVTLTSSGRLVSLPWPRSGLRLNYQT